LEGVLATFADHLRKSLEEELGGEELDVVTLGGYHVSSFCLHSANIVFVPSLQLLHPSNKPLFLLSDLSELIFEPPFLALSLHLLPSQVLQLGSKFMKSL
jgi:hypothetical protein